MDDQKSPFLDNHQFVDEAIEGSSSAPSTRYQNIHSLEDVHHDNDINNVTTQSVQASGYSYSEASDSESFASALPTPNLNVDSQRFAYDPSYHQPSTPSPTTLRFNLPAGSSSRVPLGSAKPKITSPFMDSNVILEDKEFRKPQSPFVPELQEYQVSLPGDEDEYEDGEGEGGEDNDHVMKRHRWGTTRHKTGRPKKENLNRSKTLMGLLHNNNNSRHGSKSGSRNVSRSGSATNKKKKQSNDDNNNHNNNSNNNDDDHDDESELEEIGNNEPAEENDNKHIKRTIVFNRPLPEEFIDQETRLPTTNYPRNKIRTTKYTPLSFLPKNIFNQFFNNIANIYFFAMIILGAFSIFGVPSPVLAAVPLIVIVIITAFKDAIEDSRRTSTDMEVNNQITHILSTKEPEIIGDEGEEGDSGIYQNNNVNDEKISLWRKFKKWNTKQLFRFIGASKRNLSKEGRAKKARDKLEEQKKNDEALNNRKSFDSAFDLQQSENPFERKSMDARKSMDMYTARKSMQSRRSMGRRSMAREKSKLKFSKKYWKDVRVGDILRIYNNDEIPADVVILSTSDDDNCCYVETKNLDGETNLKVRQALKFGSNIKRADDLLQHDFEVNSEGPHPNLYSYQANVNYKLNNTKPGEEDSEVSSEADNQEAVTINNILLRGCSLRNTKWVIGIVVFTGDDTKIMLNAGITPTKQSRISRDLNHYVYVNFLLLFALCFSSGVINGVYYTKNPASRDYFEFGTIAGAPWKNGLVNFFVAVILYQSLIPISLYITIEIIKTAQAYFIYSDIGMYYERLDFPCTPKSWSISDDLGQIEYIFSDKTGTLTQNLMEFKKCTINGISYGRAYTEALAGLKKRQGVDVETESQIEKEKIAKDRIEMIDVLREISTDNEIYEDELTFVSSEFAKSLISNEDITQKECNEHFMLCLALCHSVLTEEDPKQPGKLQLKAQSPDEAALVGTARALGFEFNGTTKRGLIVSIQGERKEYQVLNTLEFNSTRKRMSAIIKIPATKPNSDPTALLICKGADSIIYDRLSKTKNNKELLSATAAHLEEYATEGLRTLCIAQRVLTWSQYEEWNRRHQIAAAALDEREAKMEAVADSIERELVLLGGTAIEDRLQDGVPDAIALLGQAGIKLWVLTGDKVETAINIGFSCNLLGNDMELLILKTTLDDEEKAKYGIPNSKVKEAEIVDMLITKYLSLHFQMDGSIEELDDAIGDHSPPHEGFGVVIDGDALKLALLDPDTRRKFLLLCKQCRAVLCCRVSPAQKAAVVKLVKDTLDVMTLAIGDGSNDVAMIQAADVGVGIAGEEGRQAVMSSDYAIGQFRYLAKLLLAHGRWSYKRFSEMIPSFFYKNVIFSFSLYWYGVYSDFDGTYLFEFTFLTFYNLAFTSLPVIFLGVLDQDVSGVVSLLVPQLYVTGILRTEWTELKFWIYIADGIYQSAISFFFPYLMYRKGFTGMNGNPIDHRFWIGVIVTCIACISCNLYILFHQYRWDWLSGVIVAFSILVIYFWTIVWSSVVTSAAEFYYSGAQLFQNGTFWACTFIGVIICLLPRFTYDFVQKILWPKDIDIIRECVSRGDFDAYPRDYDPTDPNRAKISKYSSDTVTRMSGSLSTRSESPVPIPTLPEGSSSAVPHPNTDVAIGSPDINGNPKIIVGETVTNRKHVDNNHLHPNQVSPTKRKSVLDIFKRNNVNDRNSNIRSYYDNGSLIDGYNFSNETREDLSGSVNTEEIPLDEFDFAENQRRVSRISGENQRYTRKSIDGGNLQRIRTSLDFPELTNTNSLVSRVSGEISRNNTRQ